MPGEVQSDESGKDFVRTVAERAVAAVDQDPTSENHKRILDPEVAQIDSEIDYKQIAEFENELVLIEQGRASELTDSKSYFEDPEGYTAKVKNRIKNWQSYPTTVRGVAKSTIEAVKGSTEVDLQTQVDAEFAAKDAIEVNNEYGQIRR